jgi:hypothetical protein
MGERRENHGATYYEEVELTANYTPLEASIIGARSYDATVNLEFWNNTVVPGATVITIMGPDGPKRVCMADELGDYKTARSGDGKTGDITYGRNEQTGTGCLVRWPRLHATTDPSRAKTQNDQTASGAEIAETLNEEEEDQTV